MARNRASAKAAGASFERLIADGLAQALDDDRIDRMVRRGSQDRGDIAGVRVWSKPLTIEVKNCTTMSIASWVKEAHIEAGNQGDALCGIVIAKRRGTTKLTEQYVHMTVGDLIAILTGVPQEGRYE